MVDNLTIYSNLLTTIFFFILLLVFLFQTTKKHRSAPYLIISLLFGVLGALFTNFDSIFVVSGEDWIYILVLLFYDLQYVFFFLFMETLQSLKVSALKWSFITTLFTIDIFASIGLLLFSNFTGFSGIEPTLWSLANISSDILGLFIFLIIGVPVYLKTYKYAKEVRPLLMSIALLVVSVGFLLMTIDDFMSFYGISYDTLTIWESILPMLGLLVFMLCYITNIDYIYRLPNDNYMLMVSYKSGVTIHSVRFKTRYRHVEIEENLLSGLITSVGMVFKSVLDSHEEVQNIFSKDATILIQSGKYITATLVSSNVSAILNRSLRRYVKEFEIKFHKKLESEEKIISDFDSATELLKPIFPYLIILKQ